MKYLILVSLITLSSCAKESPSKLEFDETPSRSSLGQNIPDFKVSFEQLQKDVIQPLGCINCHGNMKSLSGFQTYIKSGEPFNSKAYLRMENQTMPPFGTKASSNQLELLEAFIRN